jgi:HSP20 family protein
METEAEIVMTADLPGMGPEDIAIEVADGILSVSGERRDHREDADAAGYRRLERSHGRFSRALRLPRGTDPEQVRASFDRGVLEVRVAKPEQPRPHKVAIESGARPDDEGRPEAIEAEATQTS